MPKTMAKVLKTSDFNAYLSVLKAVDPLHLFTTHILEYSERTKIQFLKSNATTGWEKYGISNLRGFAPQRRQVLVNSNLNLTSSAVKTEAEWSDFYFLIHDLLHIYFYDQVSLELGNDIWQSEDSFMACHLASEAFAVLALDYFVFPWSPLKKIGLSHPYGIAAYVRPEWIHGESSGEQTLKSRSELARKILNLYREAKKLELEVDGKVSVELRKLIAHETNYSIKQRIYSTNWWNFLNGKKVLETPKIHFFKVQKWEPELICKFFSRLLGGNSSNQEEVAAPKNYFAALEGKTSSLDFRFQNIFSFQINEAKRLLREGFGVNPSFHFLAGQLLCVAEPKNSINSRFLKEIAFLYGKGPVVNGSKNDTARRLVHHLEATLEDRFEIANYNERDVFYLS